MKGREAWDGPRFHPLTEKGMQFETCEFSRIFCLCFELWAMKEIETSESEARIKETTAQEASAAPPCANMDRTPRTQGRKGAGPVLIEQSVLREKPHPGESQGPHGASV